MKSLYVAMRGGSSPIAIVIPSPYAVFSTRKAANDYIKTKRDADFWYVRKVVSMLEFYSEIQK